jgi:hypothetical protein
VFPVDTSIPILLLPWFCLRGGGVPNLGIRFSKALVGEQSVATPQAARCWARPPCRHFKTQSCHCLGSGNELPLFGSQCSLESLEGQRVWMRQCCSYVQVMRLCSRLYVDGCREALRNPTAPSPVCQRVAGTAIRQKREEPIRPIQRQVGDELLHGPAEENHVHRFLHPAHTLDETRVRFPVLPRHLEFLPHELRDCSNNAAPRSVSRS